MFPVKPKIAPKTQSAVRGNRGAMRAGIFFGIIFALLSDASAAARPPVCPPETQGTPPNCVADAPSTGFCEQFASVIPAVPMAPAWGVAARWNTSDLGAFGNNTVLVFKLTVPPGTPTSTVAGRYVLSEDGGPRTSRQMTLSKQPCDFRESDWVGVLGPFAISNGTTASISYAVAPPAARGPAGLAAGETYYVNVRNWQVDPSPQDSCGRPTCDAIIYEQPASAPPPVSTRTPRGNVDVATARSISGWAADAAQQAGVTVKITADGVVAGTVVATQPRPDVHEVYPQFPINCGWTWTPPAALATGTHVIDIVLLATDGTHVELSGSPVVLRGSPFR